MFGGRIGFRCTRRLQSAESGGRRGCVFFPLPTLRSPLSDAILPHALTGLQSSIHDPQSPIHPRLYHFFETSQPAAI